jgi:signal transduction histidine kinase
MKGEEDDLAAAETRHVRAIDEVTRLERRVHELEDELEEAQRLSMIGTTMTGLAHSIRSTLGLCRAATYMVDRALKKWDRSELERAWGMVERSHGRVTEMVGLLLDPERAVGLAIQPADPNAVVREVGEVAAEEAMDQGDELQLDLDEDLDGVTFDRQALHRCCVELVANALDALVEKAGKGQVVIRTEREEDGWVMTVADTGPGMTEEQLRRALRGGYSSKGKAGSGRGLAQARELVQRHGGHLEVSTEPGEGTSIRCWFPLEIPKQGGGDNEVQT